MHGARVILKTNKIRFSGEKKSVLNIQWENPKNYSLSGPYLLVQNVKINKMTLPFTGKNYMICPEV